MDQACSMYIYIRVCVYNYQSNNFFLHSTLLTACCRYIAARGRDSERFTRFPSHDFAILKFAIIHIVVSRTVCFFLSLPINADCIHAYVLDICMCLCVYMCVCS